MALVVSLKGIIDKEMIYRSKIHNQIFVCDKVKHEGYKLMDKVIAKYEFKFGKRFDDFNIIEKYEAEEDFQAKMKPIYKKHNVTPVREIKGVTNAIL